MSKPIINPFRIVGEADRYHQFRPRYHSIPFKFILAEKKERYEKALDVACGTGHSSEALKIVAKKIIGVDCSEEMLRVAKKFSSIPFIQADAKKLPFEDSSVDFINISMGYHWLDQDEFLEEAKRVLSPEGQFCINSISVSDQISENKEKQAKHSDFLEQCLPRASRRKGYPTDDMSSKNKLTLNRKFQFSTKYSLGSYEFVNLLMTWSNYQILSSTDKQKIEKLMQKTYREIFQGEKLTLTFNGKANLYSFGA